MEAVSLSQLVAQAQTAISKGDYTTAKDHFTSLITQLGGARISSSSASLAIPLLSRATCFIELKDWQGAIEDATLALTLPNTPTPKGMFGASPSTHVVACSILASAHSSQGHDQDMTKYTAKARQLREEFEVNAKTATLLKEEGNELFKQGEFGRALGKYRQGMEKNQMDETIIANASICFIKLGDFEAALEMGERCTLINPSWPKAWFRKGEALLSLERWVEARTALQQGLTLAPKDRDLLRALECADIAIKNSLPSMSAAGKIIDTSKAHETSALLKGAKDEDGARKEDDELTMRKRSNAAFSRARMLFFETVMGAALVMLICLGLVWAGILDRDVFESLYSSYLNLA